MPRILHRRQRDAPKPRATLPFPVSAFHFCSSHPARHASRIDRDISPTDQANRATKYHNESTRRSGMVSRLKKKLCFDRAINEQGLRSSPLGKAFILHYRFFASSDKDLWHSRFFLFSLWIAHFLSSFFTTIGSEVRYSLLRLAKRKWRN